MRNVDLEPIRAALAARSEHAARDGQQFKRVEHWRERLIAEGAPALDELMQWRPGMDRTEWLRRIAAAKTERDRLGTGGAASRELFRALRALLDRATIDPQ
jgi:ribosome-associated protein